MTVQSTNTRIPYVADGITGDYLFDMKTYVGSWIVVAVDEVIGTYTLTVTLSTDQKVNPGGSVNLNPVPPVGSKVIIDRVVSLTQLTDFATFGGFPADTSEDALDKLTFITQQLLFDSTFALRHKPYEPKRNMQIPDIATRSLRVQTYDQDGNADVSDLVAVPIKILNCVVNFNGEPYNATPGEADSTAAIQNALNSGANYVTGCPGIYNVNGLTIPSNVSLIAPGVTLNGIPGTEANFLAFSDASATIRAENIHIELQAITGFDNIYVQNYLNCSIRNTIIDGVFAGLTIGSSGNNGISYKFSMSNVIIRNCNNGAIRPATGPNKYMNIAFENVSVEACSFRPIEFGVVSGHWTGGHVIDNIVTAFRGAMEFNLTYGTRGFSVRGVNFNNNGNATLDSLDIYVAKCDGLEISSCTFENNNFDGRGWAIGTGAGAGIKGMHVISNYIYASTYDSASFIGIQITTGSINNFVAANTVLALTGGQVAEVVDVANNYHIVNGVKQ